LTLLFRQAVESGIEYIVKDWRLFNILSA